MFTISAKTVIDAPPDTVWRVLTAFDEYDTWSSMLLPQQTAPPELNELINLRLAMPGGFAYNFSPKVTVLDANQHFAWRQKTGLPGVFDGEHHFELTPLDDGRTEMHNYEHYSGILSPLFKRLPMMKDAPAGFEAMNAEIKARAEQLAKG